MNELEILGLLVWYLVGCYGFYYWWTKDFDLTIKELPLLLFAGIIGILSFVGGYFIHGDEKKPIFKKRN